MYRFSSPSLVFALNACKSNERDGAPSLEVLPLDLKHATHSGDAAVVDYDRGTPWPSSCQIHRACPPLAALPHCAPGLAPVDADRFGDSPPVAFGERLAVRGELAVGFGEKAAVACADGCCQNSTSRNAFVSHKAGSILLDAAGCSGDQSRMCCDVPAFGQQVVAVGKLGRAPPTLARFGVRWSLGAFELCVEH